jgi:hypothetical protein
VAGFSQDTTQPSDGDESSCVIDNIIAVNVGKNIIYDGRGADTNGVFTFDRASNLTVSNVQIFNDAAYGTIGGIFFGKCDNINTSNIVFNGTALAAVNGNTWSESDTPGTDGRVVSNCVFDFVSLGTLTDVVVSEIGGSAKMTKVVVRGVVAAVTSDLVQSAEMGTKTDCFLDILHRGKSSRVRARFDKIFPTGLTYTNLTNQVYTWEGLSAYDYHGMSIGISNGGGLGDGVALKSVKPAGGNGNMFLYDPDNAVSGYTETDGFHVNGSAWNGRHFIMGDYHFWVDGTGDFRIKDGAPASDTDGAIVGTQS